MKAHYSALETLSGYRMDGAKLYSKLLPIERTIHKHAERYCNGEINSDTWERYQNTAKTLVTAVFKREIAGLWVNGDPRGYALKIDERSVPEGMIKDWGGYGILAPDIKEG